MAIDATTFVAEYPEFTGVNIAQPAMVLRALRLAQTQAGVDVFGDSHQDAVFLLAAHGLAMSPFGENLRIKDGTSVYWDQWVQLRDAKRPRVMLGGGLGGGGW